MLYVFHHPHDNSHKIEFFYQACPWSQLVEASMSHTRWINTGNVLCVFITHLIGTQKITQKHWRLMTHHVHVMYMRVEIESHFVLTFCKTLHLFQKRFNIITAKSAYLSEIKKCGKKMHLNGKYINWYVTRTWPNKLSTYFFRNVNMH